MKTQLALLFLVISSINFSQNSIDLANVYYRTSPFNTVKDSAHMCNLNTIAVDLKIPLVINDNNVAIVGLEHQKTKLAAPLTIEKI